jgi:hypothetical protein
MQSRPFDGAAATAGGVPLTAANSPEGGRVNLTTIPAFQGDSSMTPLDRRNFLRVSGAAAATLSSGALSQVKGANERVNVAVIGVRG